MEEEMGDMKNNERPEVYALRQESGNWQISRRDFLKAASIGTAALGIGLNSRFVSPVSAAESLEELCKNALAHQSNITDLRISPDGSYLFSIDEDSKMKCWDMESHALLTYREDSGKAKTFDCTASIDGEEVVLKADGDKGVRGYQLSVLEEIAGRIAETSENTGAIKSVAWSRDGFLYAVTDKYIIRLTYNDAEPWFANEEILYASLDKVEKLGVFYDDSILFILKEKGYAVLDLETGEMKDLEKNSAYDAFAPFEDGNEVLICGKNSDAYRYVSMTDGSVLWENKLGHNITAAAVTPDGSCGILLGNDKLIRLISMKDGAVVNRLEAGSVPLARIAVSPDGSQCAVAVGKSILFLSLPDLRILGCPVDLLDMKKETKGIEVKGTDPLTGQTITYTLPCGAPIPEGAVCICNCVEGKVCTCDTVCSCVGHKICTCDTVCSCVGYKICTCDTVCSCVGHVVTSHYWHPN